MQTSGLLPVGVKTLSNTSTGQLASLLEAIFSTKNIIKVDPYRLYYWYQLLLEFFIYNVAILVRWSVQCGHYEKDEDENH